MKAKCIRWKELKKRLSADHLVFWDESGINLGMIRRYGRALCGKRIVDHSPLNKSKTTTVVAAIRTNGVFAQTNIWVIQRKRSSCNTSGKHWFLHCIRKISLLWIICQCITPQIVQMIHQAGTRLLYLPSH